MNKVTPFRAVSYNQDKIKDLSSVTCPPYDIISLQRQQYYHSLSPHNLIRIILGKDTSGENKYQRAGTYFKDWLYVSPDQPAKITSMRENTYPHDLILTNYDYNPMNWYYFQRNVIGLMIGDSVINFKNPYKGIQNIYFMTDVYDNAKISCGTKEIVNKDLLYICKLN